GRQERALEPRQPRQHGGDDEVVRDARDSLTEGVMNRLAGFAQEGAHLLLQILPERVIGHWPMNQAIEIGIGVALVQVIARAIEAANDRNVMLRAKLVAREHLGGVGVYV